MENTINHTSSFNPDLATLPILIADWDDSPYNARIVYQNNVLQNDIGYWKDHTLLELLDGMCEGNGNTLLNTLIEEGELSFPCKVKNLEIKFHSRLATDHIQITISDNTEINRLRDIEHRSKLIDTFLNIGSHELKTPLNGILGMSSLLREEEKDEGKKELLDLIINSAVTLDNVVLKMLRQIYSYKEKDIITAIVELNVGKTIEQSLPIFKNCLTGRDFSANDIMISDKLNVQFPEGYLNDILLEIAINLRRNTPPKGKVRISTFDKDNEVHIVIENEGTGIPEKDLKKVFEPFYRHQDKMNHSSGYEYQQAGAGMGLTILKRNVETAGGKVWFENMLPYEEGKENIVRLTIVLPSAQQD